MTKTLKKPVAFISAAVMFMIMLLYFPSGIFSNIDFGLKASAEGTITPKEPEGDGGGFPYQIGTAEELYWFAAEVNSGTTSINAVLTKDITVNTGNVANCNGTKTTGWIDWTPIGKSSCQYTGTFDGQKHTISGLYFNDTTKVIVGLFGDVGSGGSVSNVGVVDSYFKGQNGVGGVCGENDGTITNCYNTGTVSGTNGVGGVCGFNAAYGNITYCYNTGSVSGTENVGGVCGLNGNGRITYCYNTGNITATDTYADVGGVCGGNADGNITNCYYLEGTATKGIGVDAVSGSAESKTAEEFSNGTVCDAIGYHSHQNGICALCKGDYEPATKTTNKYDIDNNGSKDTVYEISNAGQLYWFADKVNSTYESKNAVLTDDITVNNNVLNANGNPNGTDFISWTPIGNSSNEYSGTFDGQNHTISGLYFNDSNKYNVGLFGYVFHGSVSNVGIVDSYFNGAKFVGGVCGYNEGGTITNCYNTGSVSGSGNVGGVCGENFDSTITNCYNTGSVSGSGDVGGVCGNNNSKITNCYYLAGKASTGIGNGYGSDSAESKTEAQFKSGEVAYLLSQVFTVGSTTYDGTVWGQTLTGEDKQNYPVLGGAKVFATTVCVTYNNSKSSEKAHNFTIITTDTHECKDCGLNERHTFDANSQCTVCKAIKINETTFPDEKFRKWIQSQSYGSDGVLSAGEIAAVTEIDCSNKEIADLTGIKYFTALKTLKCNGNNLTSLDVSGSSSLETLECTYNNNLTLLNTSGCKNLKILECERNGNLTTLDVSSCKFLESLVCNNNKLQSLNLSGCTSLINLTCHTNNLTRLDLKDCKKLYILCCNTNNLTCLDLESMNFTSNDHRLVLDGNTFDIGEVDDEYDLKALIESKGGNFSKVDKESVTGATLTAEGKLTGFNENGGTITYEYNTGANVSVQENKIMTVTLTYKPAACQHVAGYAKKINVYPSTCVSKGSYTLQIYCGKCNELMSAKRYLTPLAAHTYGDFYDCSDNSHAKECTVCGDTITGAHTFINGSCRDCGAKTVDEYSVNIYFDGKLNKTAVYKSGSVASVSAPAIEGKVFSHWSDTPEGTRKLGTRELFRFYVSGDRDIYAIYTDTEVEQEPLVYSSNAYSFVSGVKNYVRFEFTRDIPSAYEVMGHGIIYGNSTTVFGKGDEDSLMRFTESDYSVLPTKVKYMEFTGTSGTGMDYLNVSVGTSKDAVVYARGYAIVRDKTSGETKIIYSDVKSGSFNTLNQ